MFVKNTSLGELLEGVLSVSRRMNEFLSNETPGCYAQL